ncbi:hypothetical protein [Desertibacillus haloalkaliphilus]|nr:hypothetical protein [Desertibacillus haloalkaliphilus]
MLDSLFPWNTWLIIGSALVVAMISPVVVGEWLIHRRKRERNG